MGQKDATFRAQWYVKLWSFVYANMPMFQCSKMLGSVAELWHCQPEFHCHPNPLLGRLTLSENSMRKTGHNYVNLHFGNFTPICVRYRERTNLLLIVNCMVYAINYDIFVMKTLDYQLSLTSLALANLWPSPRLGLGQPNFQVLKYTSSFSRLECGVHDRLHICPL